MQDIISMVLVAITLFYFCFMGLYCSATGDKFAGGFIVLTIVATILVAAAFLENLEDW